MRTITPRTGRVLDYCRFTSPVDELATPGNTAPASIADDADTMLLDATEREIEGR